MKEEWRDIPNYEGDYQVSNMGRVRSLGMLCAFGVNTKYVTGRVLKQQRAGVRKRYHTVALRRKRFYVHRLVALAFTPPIDDKLHINHKDCNPSNNYVGNLEYY